MLVVIRVPAASVSSLFTLLLFYFHPLYFPSLLTSSRLHCVKLGTLHTLYQVIFTFCYVPHLKGPTSKMPSVLSKFIFTTGAFAARAAAHGLVSGVVTDGTYNQGFILDYYYEKINTGSYPNTAGWYEEATDNGYVAPSSYGEADIICHKNADNANATATVSAGGTVDFQWNTWPQSHIGPVLTYVANCGSGDNACSTVDKTTLEWVKIDEAGIDLDTQTWPTDDLIANNNTWSVTVPSSLASGSYVFRHEIIAMHGAGSEGGAQNYPFCVNIAITDGGSENPSGTLGTALYKSDGTSLSLLRSFQSFMLLTIPVMLHLELPTYLSGNKLIMGRSTPRSRYSLQPLHHPHQLRDPRP